MKSFRVQKHQTTRVGKLSKTVTAIAGHGLGSCPAEPIIAAHDVRQNLASAQTAPAGIELASPRTPGQEEGTAQLRRSKRVKLSHQNSAPVGHAVPEAKDPDMAVADVVLDEIAASIVANTSIADKKKPRGRKAKAKSEDGLGTPDQPKPARKRSKKEIELTAGASQSLKIWSEEEIDIAVEHLRASDPALVRLLDSSGPARPERLLPKGCQNVYGTLTRTIIGQQLATGAARIIYGRFLDLVKKGPGEYAVPSEVLAFDEETLKTVGLSRQKASYIKSLAEHFASGELSDDKVRGMDDQTLITELTKVKGIGRWTVDMFAMFDLGHCDVLPVGDLGVRNGMKYLYSLKEAPSIEKMEELTDKWRPYRSLGSYLMWHALDQEKIASKKAKLEATPSKSKKKQTSSIPDVTTVPL